MEVLKNRRILRGRDITHILSALPPDLDATYERILTNIDPPLIYEAAMALEWLSSASRPMFVEELVEACIIRPDKSDPVEHDQRLGPFDILEILPGLVRIEPTPENTKDFRPRRYTITLSHFSVKEYLFSDRIRQGPAQRFSINLGVSHYHIARSCLAYVAHCQSLNLSHHDVSRGLYHHSRYYYAHCQSLNSSRHNTSPPLHDYAHSRWPLHAALISESSIAEVSHQVIELFQSPKLCLRWIGSAAVTNREPDLKISQHAHENPKWPLHYILCHSVITRNKALVQALLNSGLQIHSYNAAWQPLRLAARTGDSSIVCILLQAGADTSGALICALRSGHEDVAKILLEAGIRPDGSELLISAKRSSASLFQHLVATSSPLGILDVLKVLDAAIGSRKHESAKALWEALVQRTLQLRQKHNRSCYRFNEHKDCYESRLFFRVILNTTIRLDSSRLLMFVLQRTSKATLDALDTNAMFLKAIVQGSKNSIHILEDYAWFPISTDARSMNTAWKSLMADNRACTAILALHSRYISNGLRMPGNTITADTKSIWELLRTLEPVVVAHYVQLWSTYQTSSFSDRRIAPTDCGVTEQAFINIQTPQSLHRRLEAYMVLSGPYSSFLRDVYAVQFFRQTAVQRLKLLDLISALPHEISEHRSSPHLFLGELMQHWSEFFETFVPDYPFHPLQNAWRPPQSSVSKQSLERFSTRLATTWNKFQWLGDFMASQSVEVSQMKRMLSITEFEYSVQGSRISHGHVQKPDPSLATINSIAIHIKIRSNKARRGKYQERLQRNLGYHLVIHGPFHAPGSNTRESTDPRLINLPSVVFYKHLLIVDLVSDRPRDMILWDTLWHSLITAAGFFCIFPPRYSSSLLSLGWDDQAAKREPCARMNLCREVRSDGLSDGSFSNDGEENTESCIKLLEALLEAQNHGWALVWSRVSQVAGLLPSADSESQDDSEIQLDDTKRDTKQICERLIDSSLYEDANAEMYTLPETSSPRAGLSSNGTSGSFLT